MVDRMTAQSMKKPAGITATLRRTLLSGVSGAAKTKARADRMFDNLIVRAVEQGLTQVEVAKAAGVSQAHISRTVAANRKLNEERNAARRSKRAKSGGSV